jgi:transcriptional regulator with XRE-family HTH domain
MSEPNLSLDPKLLGFWVKCIREASNWSQEAVAATAGLDVRTIQRAEAGSSISLASRRSLARGLGFDDYDTFQKPEFIDAVQGLLDLIKKKNEEEYYKQFPDCLRIEAFPVRKVGDFERIVSSNAYSFSADPNLSSEAKELAATLFDCLQDLGDCFNDLSHIGRLNSIEGFQSVLDELEELGAVVLTAKRLTTISSSNWVDKTPLRIDIGYVAVAPSTTEIKEVVVSKRLKFEF